MVTILASLRRRLDIEPGDKFRLDTVVKQHYCAFDDFEPVSMGSDGTETHDFAVHPGQDIEYAVIDDEKTSRVGRVGQRGERVVRSLVL